MPIELVCECGKRFRVADRFAGKSGACPSCGKAFTVPVPKTLAAANDDEADGLLALADAVDDAAEVRVTLSPEAAAQAEAKSKRGRTCVGCGAPLAERAMICTACGRSAVTGKTLATRTSADEPRRGAWLLRPILEVGPLRLSPVALVVLLLLVGLPIVWYVNGPGRALAVRSASAVWVIQAMDRGATRDQFSLLTGQGDLSLGLEGGLSGITGSQADDGDALHYSVGGRDGLWVIRPDGAAAQGVSEAATGASGRGVLLEVGLRQSTLRAAGATSGYDTVIQADDFELVPLDGQHGGQPLSAELLAARFGQSEATLDLGSAETSSVNSALPAVEPTRFSKQEDGPSVSALAVYDGETTGTHGTVRVQGSRSYGGQPAAPGVFAEGELRTTHPQANDFGVSHRYVGDEVVVDWDEADQGRWSRERMSRFSEMSPWYRYEFGLLFRPAEGDLDALAGRFAVRFAGRELAEVTIDGPDGSSASDGSTASPTTTAGAPSGGGGPVSPIKRQQGVPSTRTINPNNPLSYFDILLESRDQARGLVSANSLRQIGLGLQTYVQTHGEFPESFEELDRHMPGTMALLANPRTGEDPGFIYEKPPRGAPPATTPVVWETFNGAKDPNGAVLYADGSIR